MTINKPRDLPAKCEDLTHLFIRSRYYHTASFPKNRCTCCCGVYVSAENHGAGGKARKGGAGGDAGGSVAQPKPSVGGAQQFEHAVRKKLF